MKNEILHTMPTIQTHNGVSCQYLMNCSAIEPPPNHGSVSKTNIAEKKSGVKDSLDATKKTVKIRLALELIRRVAVWALCCPLFPRRLYVSAGTPDLQLPQNKLRPDESTTFSFLG